MFNPRTLVVVVLASALASCALPPPRELRIAQESLPPGTRLIVNRPFTVPAGHSGLWFQGGGPRGSGGLTVWVRHCSLDLHRRVEVPTEFTEGEMMVTDLRESEWGGIGVALRRVAVFPIEPSDRGAWTVETVLGLSSVDHPIVRQLRCERMIDSRIDHEPLTAEELKRVLGDYFRIEPALGKAGMAPAIGMRDRLIPPSGGAAPPGTSPRS